MKVVLEKKRCVSWEVLLLDDKGNCVDMIDKEMWDFDNTPEIKAERKGKVLASYKEALKKFVGGAK